MEIFNGQKNPFKKKREFYRLKNTVENKREILLPSNMCPGKLRIIGKKHIPGISNREKTNIKSAAGVSREKFTPEMFFRRKGIF